MWQIYNEGGENQDSGSCGKSFNQSWNTSQNTSVIIVQNLILNQEISRGTSRQSI